MSGQLRLRQRGLARTALRTWCCSRLTVAFYLVTPPHLQFIDCSKQCQRANWPQHKQECTRLKQAADDNRVPEERVFGSSSSGSSGSGSGSGGGGGQPRLVRAMCGLCGNRKAPFQITECCGRVVCHDQSNYVLMSYSRDSCSRNHSR